MIHWMTIYVKYSCRLKIFLTIGRKKNNQLIEISVCIVFRSITAQVEENNF